MILNQAKNIMYGSREVQKVYLGSQLIWSRTGFRTLDFIRTTNCQYFNTGYVPNDNTRIECEVMLLDNYDQYGQTLFGTNMLYLTYNSYGNHRIQFAWGGNSTTVSKSLPYYRKIKIILDKELLSWYDGETLIDSVSAPTGTTAYGGRPIWIGCYNNSGSVSNFGEFCLYSFKIYENNSLIMNFVPVKRISGGVSGMLETLTNVFYPDINGNGFLSSVFEDNFEVLESLDTDGRLWIDTAFVHTTRTKLVIDSIPLCTGTNGIIFLGSVLNNDYDSDAWGIWTRSQFRFVRGHSDEDSARHIIAPCPDVDISVRCTITIENDTLMVTHTDGTSETFTDTNAIVGDGILSMYLFNLNTANSSRFWPNAGATARFYSCQIYDNNVLIRDFIPVKQLSDNALMLYDRVLKIPFLPKGSGNFQS